MAHGVTPGHLKNARARDRRARQEAAGRLLGAGDLTDLQIAARLGVSRRTIARWKKLPAVLTAAQQEREARLVRFEQEMERRWQRRLRGMSERELLRDLARLRRRLRRGASAAASAPVSAS